MTVLTRTAAIVAGLVFSLACRNAPDTGSASSVTPASGQATPAGARAQVPASAEAPPPARPGRTTPVIPAEARPSPPPRVVLTLPAGTELRASLQTAASSRTSQIGDLVVAELLESVSSAGRVVLPRGSELRGRVTAAVPSGRVKGRARLAFVFDEVELRGQRQALVTHAIDITAASGKKRDVVLIGGGAGAGGLIGGLVGGKKGAGLGVLIGAGAGTGAALATKGKEVELAAGQQLRLELAQAARLD